MLRNFNAFIYYPFAGVELLQLLACKSRDIGGVSLSVRVRREGIVQIKHNDIYTCLEDALTGFAFRRVVKVISIAQFQNPRHVF